MEAKVITRFRDKHSLTVYPVGSTYNGDEQRIEELKALGFLDEDSLDEDVIDQRLKGNVEDIKSLTDGLGIDEYKKLLEEEKNTKNRKGLITYFKSMIEVIEGKGNPSA